MRVQINGEDFIPHSVLETKELEIIGLRYALMRALREIRREACLAVDGSTKQEYLLGVAIEIQLSVPPGVMDKNL